MSLYTRSLFIFLFSIPTGVAFAYQLPPGFEPKPIDPELAKLPEGPPRVVKPKLLWSSDESQEKAIAAFRRSTSAREKIAFADFDFLIREIRITNGELLEPTFKTGKVKENFATGDLQVESIAFRNGNLVRAESTGAQKQDLDDQTKQIIQEREETWKEEKERLQKFVLERQFKDDFGPDEIELKPISNFFHADEQSASTGGVFVSTADMSLVGRLGSSRVTIESPGMSMPRGTTYFDLRALGLENQVELSQGASVDVVLRRLNTGVPFSVEEHSQKPFVTIGYARSMKRILFDPDRDYLPTYAVNFYGNERSEHKALIYRSDEIQLQWWMNAVNVNGVWVPKRARVLTPIELIDIEMKWFNVNENIPESGFGVETIRLPPGTRVFDRRRFPPSTTILQEGSNWTSDRMESK